MCMVSTVFKVMSKKFYHFKCASVTLWWTSDLLVFIILYILHNSFIQLKERGCHDSEGGLGEGGKAVRLFLTCSPTCIHVTLSDFGRRTVVFAADVWGSGWEACVEGICSWRVLCHWRSPHRLSAQHPPSFSSVRCQCSIFTMGRLRDGVSVCLLGCVFLYGAFSILRSWCPRMHLQQSQQS